MIGRTRLLWIGKHDRGEFWIRVLLFFHGNERFEAKALETSINEYVANAVQRSVDKLDVR
jgi:predicted HicB family RNase H-like nuclease